MNPGCDFKARKGIFLLQGSALTTRSQPCSGNALRAAAWRVAVSSLHPHAGAQLASQDAFPSCWDHWLPQSSKKTLPSLYLGGRIWPRCFQQSFREARGGVAAPAQEKKPLAEARKHQGCWGKMLWLTGIRCTSTNQLR